MDVRVAVEQAEAEAEALVRACKAHFAAPTSEWGALAFALDHHCWRLHSRWREEVAVVCHAANSRNRCRSASRLLCSGFCLGDKRSGNSLRFHSCCA